MIRRLLLAPLVVCPVAAAAVIARSPYLWPVIVQIGAYFAPRPATAETEGDLVG